MIVSAEKVLAGSGMGPVGEDSAAPRQGANDPDAGWKGGSPWCTRFFLGLTESLKTISDIRYIRKRCKSTSLLFSSSSSRIELTLEENF